MAAADVGVEMIGAFGGFGDGAEEAALVITKGFGIDFAGVHGGVDMAVVLDVDNIDCEFTGVEFDIFIASDALDADFASRDTGIEIEDFRDVDRNGQVVVRTTGDMQLRGVFRAGEASFYVLDLAGFSSGEIDGESGFIAADDADFARADKQAELSFGGTWRELHVGLAGLGGLNLGVGVAGRCRDHKSRCYCYKNGFHEHTSSHWA